MLRKKIHESLTTHIFLITALVLPVSYTHLNYGSIDAEILWETIENDVPKLKEYCLEIINILNKNNEDK